MSSHNNNSMIIEKLRGRENFSSWKFAMKAILVLDDLWDVVEGKTAEDIKNKKALSKIILSLDPINYSHIQDATTAKEAWDILGNVFEDSGLTRRVSLLKKLVTAQLHNYDSVEKYVNDIITNAYKLNGIGFKIDSEWIGTLMLAGLPEQYKPMIMGLESSGIKISADSIKVKLLQDVCVEEMENKENAFYSKKKNIFKCYNCGRQGHTAKFCRMKKVVSDETECRKDSQAKSFFMLYTQKNKREVLPEKCYWYLDSCASSHIVNNDALLTNIEDSKQSVTAADNKMITAKAKGDVLLKLRGNGLMNEVNIREALCIPEAAANLLSVSKIIEKGHTVSFDRKGGYIISNQGTIIATAKEVNGIYKLDTEIPVNIFSIAEDNKEENNALLWHRRLGHLNRKAMNILKDWSTGMNTFKRNNDKCVICIKAKQARKPFKPSTRETTKTLQLIHTDLCGPMEEISSGGTRYIFTLIDDYSRKAFAYFIKCKSDIPNLFLEFKAYVENETGNKIKTIRSDNGGEYTGQVFENILKKHGIKHEKTIPYTPQQNGVAERLNRTIIEKARSMLFDSELPKGYWAEATNTAIYLYNRSPTKSIKGRTPEEAWSGRAPDLSNLKIFGCKALVRLPKRQKWDPKAKELVFVGYPTDCKGWRFINPKTKTVTYSRDATFFEGDNKNCCSIKTEVKVTNPEKDLSNTINNVITDDPESDYESAREEVEEQNIPENIFINSQLDLPGTTSTETEMNEVQITTGRIKKVPKKYDDYVLYYTNDIPNDEPRTPEEALSGSNAEKWKKAMDEEHESLKRNETYEVVKKLPDSKRLLNTKWVFKIKTEGDKGIRYKARLVIKGCSQKYGVDYLETFSPVVKYATIRYLLALASRGSLQIDQMDVTAAYLYGDIDEEIYVRPPKELLHSQDDTDIWFLRKSIYGLKQSGRCWNKKLDDVLKTFQLTQSLADPCIYYKKGLNAELLIVAIYVDDFLIFYNDKNMINQLKSDLKKVFLMKDLGEIKNCLGIQITRNNADGKLWLDQKEYIERTLLKFNMEDCRPVSTPMETGIKLDDDIPDDDNEDVTNFPYQEAIGSLLYLSQITRPDISYAVHRLSTYNKCPKIRHWKAVKRIFRYLKGTTNYKLQYGNNDDTKAMVFYSDADWANNSADRHSITGSCSLYQGGVVDWFSRKQRTVALSTTEAEYMALSFTAQGALWHRKLMEELHGSNNIPLEIFCDNMGTIQLSKNKITSTKSKHIDVRHHFIRELLEDKIIEINYLPTENMLADIFTKPLEKGKFEKMVGALGLVQT